MSQATDQDRLELHVLAHRGTDSAPLVELLTVVAHYHRTGRPLGLGHTVNFGRPWLPHSICSYGLISLPYLDGRKLMWLDEPKVQFLWLIPITASELAYKKARGLEALEAKLEESRFDFLDPLRASVV